MCSNATSQLNGTSNLTLNMTRTESSELPISCTCLITSRQWHNITISRQITPSSENRLNYNQNCVNRSSVRHVYMKECVSSNCTDTSYRENTTTIQQTSNKNVTVNWMIVSFTWNKCDSYGTGATDLGNISIRGT